MLLRTAPTDGTVWRMTGLDELIEHYRQVAQTLRTDGSDA